VPTIVSEKHTGFAFIVEAGGRMSLRYVSNQLSDYHFSSEEPLLVVVNYKIGSGKRVSCRYGMGRP